MGRIKIKYHDRRPRFSIAVVISAALLIWFTLMLWSADRPTRPAQRELKDVVFTYQCEGGHRFRAPGDVKSLPCERNGCIARAWPIWSYQCPRHGAMIHQIRYAVSELDGRPRIIAARPLGGAWHDTGEEIACPLCERPLWPDLTLRIVAESDLPHIDDNGAAPATQSATEIPAAP